LIRDFQRLGGSAPNGILEQGGDIQPWSLAPHQSLEMKWRRNAFDINRGFANWYCQQIAAR
jgi:hypothetical protein